MGVVYRALDPSLRREVAIKTIELGGADPADRLRRFEREATAAARLQHPGIVAVHEVGSDAGRPFIVMELVPGESLEARLAREPVAPREAARLLREVALALQHAHDHGVVHRDVKPENILVDASGGAPKLSDFGLAREAAEDDRLTKTGQLLGTPAYMSPEQASGGSRDAIGPAVDVYALGGVLYRALVGRPPFVADSLVSLIRAVLLEDPKPPRVDRPDLHPDLETIVLRCLEKEPARRYASARDLADDLGRFLDGELIVARPIRRIERARRWARRTPGRLAAASLAALIAVGAPAAATGLVLVARAERNAERRAQLASARSEADAAWRGFVELRDARGADADADADELLGAGLRAFAAASRLESVAGEEASPDATFRAAVGLGELAIESEQWSVAAAAFERALQTGIDDPAARRFLARVATERRAVAERRRAEVRAVLDDARAGVLARRPGGFEDALFRLVRLGAPETVELIAAALDEVTAELLAARRAVYLTAGVATPHEEHTGAVAIDGLEAALDALDALAPGEELPAEAAATIARVGERLAARAERLDRVEVQRRDLPTLTRLVATEQSRAVASRSSGLADLARLCCDALGRIGIGPGAIPALGRYLVAEHDPVRCATAGVALGLIGGGDAERFILVGRRRFGSDHGSYWLRVGPFFARLEGTPDASDETAPGLARQARELKSRGRHEAAIDALGRAIAIDPDLIAARLSRGTLLFESGRFREALADFERAVELDPESAIATMNRGNARTVLGDLDGGLSDATRAIELDPTLAIAFQNRSFARYSRGSPDDLEAAEDDATRALELDPTSIHAWVNRGATRVKRGDLAGAEADLRRAIDLDPREASAWSNLGAARAMTGDLVGAIEAFVRAVDLDPENVEAWRNLGQSRHLLGDPVRAIEDFTRAIDLDRTLIDAWVGRAIARGVAGDDAAAIVDLDEALALDPDHVRAISERAGIHLRRGDPAQALADFDRAVELGTGEPRVLAMRGLAHHHLGNLEAARSDVERALELDDTLTVAWNLRGAIAAASGDLASARTFFERCVALDAGFLDAIENLVRIHERTGDLAAALDALDRWTEIAPQSVRSWWARGRILAQSERLDEARAAYDRAIDLGGSGPGSQLLWERAALREKMGDPAGAAADLRRIEASFPEGDPRRAELRAAIGRLDAAGD